MTRVYYKEAVGAFIVFDVTRKDTFQAVEKWKAGNYLNPWIINVQLKFISLFETQDLDSKVLLPDGRPIPCVLIGNKADAIVDPDLKVCIDM